MMKRYGILGILLLSAVLAYGQNERKVIREGMKAYEKGEYSDAEVQFRRAEDINQESYEADFNTGAALYGQEKFDETAKQYESLLNRTDDVQKTAQIWHNIGNSLLEAGQYGPSIEAYKNSLRKNPGDDDTRYNLAYAKQMLNEQQQQQQQQNQDKDQKQQDQGQNENKEQSDQQEQADQQDQTGQPEQQENAEQEDPPQAEQQPVSREISKEDAERLLQAIQQQEKEVKEKVDEKKAAIAKVKTEKDW